MDWTDIREQDKSEDRYKKQYPDKHDTFWYTLDSKLVAWSYSLPPVISWVVRFHLALLGTNRREPMPIGNRDSVTNLWKDSSDWYRWVRWHLRNLFVDLKRYYLGFGHYRDRAEKKRYWWFIVNWVKIGPIKWPFPRIDNPNPYYDFRIGWKDSGHLGFRSRDLSEEKGKNNEDK